MEIRKTISHQVTKTVENGLPTFPRVHYAAIVYQEMASERAPIMHAFLPFYLGFVLVRARVVHSHEHWPVSFNARRTIRKNTKNTAQHRIVRHNPRTFSVQNITLTSPGLGEGKILWMICPSVHLAAFDLLYEAPVISQSLSPETITFWRLQSALTYRRRAELTPCGGTHFQSRL